MTPLFKKLNLKAQTEILVVNAPASFESELAALEGVAVQRSPAAPEVITFALAFVTQQSEVDGLATAIAPQAPGDAILWFAYPKASSKNYACEFNRDTGWAGLGDLGFEPVRQVAIRGAIRPGIDADWSALRFRRVEFIKSMTRKTTMAISQAGKSRSAKGTDA
ncbi:MAG: hypothetical protein KME14_06645 [Tildeniella torsiva UHER 1998/13D]|jgi:hypothetical protein|nr:hypothetical protein [Tildeniella torsiva UHER 1998/13D]